MEEVIKYFESLEARIAEYEKRIAVLEEAQQTNEAVIASMEAEIEELKSRPLPEPIVVEKPVEIPASRDTEITKEPEQAKVEPEPGASPQSNGESGLRLEGQIDEPEPKVEEPASPKAAVYGKAVDDIRLAISLGDRFLYQRELFGQNAELMQRTLTELNELNSFDEALAYISKFNWDTESNTYQQFIVTLHRRFG